MWIVFVQRKRIFGCITWWYITMFLLFRKKIVESKFSQRKTLTKLLLALIFLYIPIKKTTNTMHRFSASSLCVTSKNATLSFFLFCHWFIFVATLGHCLETWKIQVCFLSDYRYNSYMQHNLMASRLYWTKWMSKYW